MVSYLAKSPFEAFDPRKSPPASLEARIGPPQASLAVFVGLSMGCVLLLLAAASAVCHGISRAQG